MKIRVLKTFYDKAGLSRVIDLIKSVKGYGIAYIDWFLWEFAIAAAISGDQAMKQAYASGDPYLEFATLAGAACPDAWIILTQRNELFTKKL